LYAGHEQVREEIIITEGKALVSAVRRIFIGGKTTRYGPYSRFADECASRVGQNPRNRGISE
jgi:hypothetical protein